ncbi:MAG: GNAT family N-acetyltransferase [Caldilineaceae bacterium]
MQTNNLQEFIIRPFRVSTDVPLFAQLRTSLIAATGEGDRNVSEQAMLEELKAPNQDPEKDRWIAATATVPDSFVGFGLGYHTLPERYLAWVEVHPAWRRKGLGSAFLAHIVRRAREVNAEHILINANANDAVAQAFLTSNGFQVKSHAWFMSTSVDLPLPAPMWPAGYTVRTFAEVQDYQILKTAYFDSCRDLWGNGANSQQSERRIQPLASDWKDWFTKTDPNGAGIFFVFAPDSHIAGLCRGIDAVEAGQGDDGPGLVDALGIVPEHRPNQLHRPLTLAVMHWLRERGHRMFTLEAYGTDEKTIDIYCQLGFKLDRHDYAYHLTLVNPAVLP